MTEGGGSPRSGVAKAAPRPLVSDSTLHSVFDGIDSNHDGVLTVADIKAALGEVGLPQTDQYVKQLLKQYDGNGDKKIDFAEFKAYVVAKEKRVQHAFSQIDTDGSGTISIEELEKKLGSAWLAITQDDAKRMIKLLDADSDGKVSLDEFRKFAYLLPEAQVNDNDILYSWVDSADWAEGIEYRLCMTPPKQPAHRLIAGGVAGALSRGSVAPLERLRTMMMADPDNRRLTDTVRKMWTNKESGGIRGLFKGNMATVLKVAPQSAVQFAVFDTVQDIMIQQAKVGLTGSDQARLTTAQHLLAGSLAGAAGTAVTYPAELLRTHMAMGSANYRSVLKDIWGSKGVGGLYQGWQAAMLSSVVSNAIGFTSYETGLRWYRDAHPGRSPTPMERACIAGAGAVTVMTCIMPFEVVMRRLQVQGRDGHPMLYSDSWDACKRIYAAEGVSAFWRGALPTYMKVAPSIAVVRLVYETLIQTWGTGGVHRYREAAHKPD